MVAKFRVSPLLLLRGGVRTWLLVKQQRLHTPRAFWRVEGALVTIDRDVCTCVSCSAFIAFFIIQGTFSTRLPPGCIGRSIRWQQISYVSRVVTYHLVRQRLRRYACLAYGNKGITGAARRSTLQKGFFKSSGHHRDT